MFTTGQFASVSNQLIVQAPAPQAEGAQIVLAWANVSGLTGQGNKTWNIDVDATNNLRVFNQDAIGGTTVPFMIRQTTSNVEIIANASVSGNIRVGNVFANGYFWANGNAFTGAGGGGGGTPGGSNTQIQYNNGGLFGGITGFTWNGTTLTAASGFQATPIGNTTPSTGNFTSLNTSGNSTANALTVNNSATIGSTLGVAGNLTVGSGPAGGNISGVNVLTANTVVATNFAYPSGQPIVGYTYVLDDISGAFDGFKTSFNLTYNYGTTVTATNPNQLQLYIGNIPVLPSLFSFDYIDLPPTNVASSGFYITGNTVYFATPPIPGMSFYGTYRTVIDSIPAFVYKQAPFKPINIMLAA